MSSALRALRNLLYGIPERSSDAFRHPFPKMRIGGTLRSAQGEALSVVRRKGRGGTLRASDVNATVTESELDRFLNGVDAGFFGKMFGIGYEDLIAGGREIVQGHGDLGRLLFSAGPGTANLSAVVDGLQAEADWLFRPSGQKQKINEAIGRLKQRRAELKEAQLPGQEWERHDQILKEALEVLVALILLGGETVRWFAVAILVGTISGTYSSPFIAVPLLVIWDEYSKKLKFRK